MVHRRGRRGKGQKADADRQEKEQQSQSLKQQPHDLPNEDPKKNRWADLDVSGFSDTGLRKPKTPKSLPHPITKIHEQRFPSANRWADFDVSGFSSIPSVQQGSNTHSDGMLTSGTSSALHLAESLRFVPTMPIHIAAERLQDRRNLESGALLSDGSVMITRNWVRQMVGEGHIEQSGGNMVLSHHSILRSRGHEFGLHPAFIRWMTEENPHNSFGDQNLRMDPDQAKEWFAED